MRVFLVALMAAHIAAGPAVAGMAEDAEYVDRAVKWAWFAGMANGCPDAPMSSDIEGEAEAGAKALAPGLWNWAIGAQEAAKQDLFARMWETFNAASATAMTGETAQTCGLRKAQLGLSAQLMKSARDRAEAN